MISGIIIRELDRGQFSFSYFYRRRVLRLFPALSIVLIVVLVAGIGVLLTDEFGTLGRHIASSVAFVQNLNLWNEYGYFDSSSEYKPLLHMWSLGVEEQFYLLWPAILLFGFKIKWDRTKFLVGLTLVSFVTNLYFAYTSAISAFYFPICRFWELFVGAWLFHLESKNIEFKIKNLNSDVYSALGILIVVLTCFLKKMNPYTGFWALLPVLAAFLIMGPGRRSRINQLIFSHPWVVGVGLISYPLYLWHWPILVIAKYLIPTLSTFSYSNEVIKAVCLAFSFVVAFLTYRYIEVPIRFQNKLKRPVLYLSLIMFILFSCGIWIWKNDGFPERDPEALVQLKGMRFFWKSQSSRYANKCKVEYKDNHSFCFKYFKDKPPTALLTGDSLANQFYPGLAKYLWEKHELNLLILAREQVPALYGTATTKTSETNNESFEKALNDPNIKMVILAQTLYMDGQIYDNINHPELKTPVDFKAALANTFKVLLDAKKEVVFILPNPYLNFNHKLCIQRPLRWIPIDNTCAISAPLAHYLEDTYRNEVLSVTKSFPQVKVFDTYKHFCDDNYCYAKRNNKILYSFDGTHLSIDGAMWISQFYDF